MTNSGSITALSATARPAMRCATCRHAGVDHEHRHYPCQGQAPRSRWTCRQCDRTSITQNSRRPQHRPFDHRRDPVRQRPRQPDDQCGQGVGNVTFGAVSNAMTLAGAGTYSGMADFGGGASTLGLSGTSSFTGGLAHAGNTAVTINGGTLNLSATGTTTIGALTLNGGTLGVTVNGTSGTASLLDVPAPRRSARGRRSRAGDRAEQCGRQLYVLQAGTLNGAANLGLPISACLIFHRHARRGCHRPMPSSSPSRARAPRNSA